MAFGLCVHACTQNTLLHRVILYLCNVALRRGLPTMGRLCHVPIVCARNPSGLTPRPWVAPSNPSLSSDCLSAGTAIKANTGAGDAPVSRAALAYSVDRCGGHLMRLRAQGITLWVVHPHRISNILVPRCLFAEFAPLSNFATP